MAGTITATTSSRKGQGIVRIDCALTCEGGAVDAAVVGSAFGRLVAVLLDPAAGSGATMTSTADVTISDAKTGAPLVADLSFGASASAYRPTQVITDNAGVAVTAATTAVDVNRDIFVAGKIKVAVANATTTDTGLISLIIEEG